MTLIFKDCVVEFVKKVWICNAEDYLTKKFITMYNLKNSSKILIYSDYSNDKIVRVNVNNVTIIPSTINNTTIKTCNKTELLIDPKTIKLSQIKRSICIYDTK